MAVNERCFVDFVATLIWHRFLLCGAKGATAGRRTNEVIFVVQGTGNASTLWHPFARFVITISRWLSLGLPIGCHASGVQTSVNARDFDA
jgi:hypothetical protein